MDWNQSTMYEQRVRFILEVLTCPQEWYHILC